MANNNDHEKDFAEWLADFAKGSANAALTKRLAEVVQACRENSGKGTLTLKLSIGCSGGMSEVKAKISYSKPDPALPSAVFFTTEAGSLVEMLKVARELHIRTKGTFQREVNPTTGDFILVNKNETETGSTVIPRAFALAIPVFEGGERYQVEARVRFQLTGSGPMFSFTMHRRAEIERDAFDGVRQIIAVGTERPVLAGTP